MPRIFGLAILTLLMTPRLFGDEPVVGDIGGGRFIVPTNQTLTPIGRLVTFPGRPVDLAMLPDNRTVVVKNLNDLILLDVDAGTITQTLRLRGNVGHAVTGLAVSSDGDRIYTSTVGGRIGIAVREGPRKPFEWKPLSLTMPAPTVGGDPAPTGLAFSTDGAQLLALSGRGNSLWRFDQLTGKTVGPAIPVGVAPFGIVVHGAKAYISNWGGDPPRPDEPQAVTSRTAIKIDPRTGAANSGSISVVDLTASKTISSIKVGPHPCGITLAPGGGRLYVACAASDEVAVIDTSTDRVIETISVRSDARLPFGSGPNALAVSPDGGRLYVANGTDNAVAVIDVSATPPRDATGKPTNRVLGFLPTAWYPGAIVLRNRRPRRSRDVVSRRINQLVVANIKGIGSRSGPRDNGRNSRDHMGAVSLIPLPASSVLPTHTRQVAENNRTAIALGGLEPPRPGIKPRPLPERHGEPSPIKHVIYIIRENRTYDQVFGDLTQADGDPKLVMFGRKVTPNAHALAEEFVLMDNYYCSGVLSADGHAWATEAYANDYLERHFGGFIRSYPYDGDDAMAYASTGFLWDNALRHKRTFRDYGEFVKATITPAKATWSDIYADYKNGTTKVKIEARPGVETLRPHICPTFVGFPGTVPDVYRVREFLKEFRDFEKKQTLPHLIMILLPNDHTEGTTPGMPTPRAMVADNDLALGQIVDAVSHSRFWPETAILVTEDDPQAGLDHVDGHRTVGLVISPYARRKVVDHSFTTQVGMVKTIELILGLPPMNIMDLAAPPLRSAFTDTPDNTPYTVKPNQIPLDDLNPPLRALAGESLKWAQASLKLDLDDVDEADEDTLNRILWHSVKGDGVPYPSLAKADDDD
jgi:YVTN family beta-propeller protein